MGFTGGITVALFGFLGIFEPGATGDGAVLVVVSAVEPVVSRIGAFGAPEFRTPGRPTGLTITTGAGFEASGIVTGFDFSNVTAGTGVTFVGGRDGDTMSTVFGELAIGIIFLNHPGFNAVYVSSSSFLRSCRHLRCFAVGLLCLPLKVV